VKLALKLMALTSIRAHELLLPPWSEFDLEDGLWKIDARRMKKSRPHIVLLSRQAVTILRQLQQTAGDKRFVFSGLHMQTLDETINCNPLLDALAKLDSRAQ
jgi:integrase